LHLTLPARKPKTNTAAPSAELVDIARLAVAGRADAVTDALASSPDPMALAAAAEHHGLAPILHVFSRARANELPLELAQRLAASYRQNKARSIILLSEAARIAPEFEKRGIPCIPLKGAALAEDLYGDPAMRPMHDVDLIVPQTSLSVAREIMIAAGYYEESGDLRAGFEEEFRSELSFYRTAPHPCRVEIHWGLLNFGGHEEWTRQAFERSVMTPRGRRLTDEETLLYLAAHSAYHHQNDRLIWEFDIALLLQSKGALYDDWTIGVLAQHHRLLMPLRWALETGERLGVPAPAHLAAVMQRRSVGRVERWALRFARDPQLASAVRTLLTLRSTPGWRRRFRLISAKLFPDHEHLQTRHHAHGFWPWVYTKRILSLSGKLVLALLHIGRPRTGKGA
jgi:hypothetical protein